MFVKRIVPMALIAAGCGIDRPLATTTIQPAGPIAEIQDATHNSGIAHFYFLPPMVSAPSYSGTTDPGVTPEVIVCEWSGGACVQEVAAFTMFSGTGGRVVEYSSTGGKYQVDWRTDVCNSGPCALDPSKTYRIRIEASEIVLGYADVTVVNNGSQLKNVNTNEFIGLVDGRTLPVKFRIEQGLVASVLVTPNPAMLAAGSSAQLAASAVDLHGNILSGLPFTWGTLAANVVTVSTSGVVTGLAEGSTGVTATAGGRTGTATVVVQPACPGLPSGLTHWWRGEGNGNDVAGGDHGTQTGTVTYAAGVSGQAFQFGNGYFSLSGTYGGPAVSEVTVMAWIQTQQSGPSAWQAILSSTDGTFLHFQTADVGGSAVYTNAPPFFNEMPAPGSGPTSVWRHFALTAKSGAIIFYLNGTPYSQSASTFTSLTQAPQVLLGNGYFFGRPFPGLVDEIQMYNRALSQAEINAAMNVACPL